MAQLCYNKLGRRWRRKRGFRLNSSRFTFLRLRLKLLSFFGLFSQCLESFKKGLKSRDSFRCGRSVSRRGLLRERRHASAVDRKPRSCTRSNSFYAEAIADCLEFIRRTSVSVDNGAAPGR